jgi:hypothetical protein
MKSQALQSGEAGFPRKALRIVGMIDTAAAANLQPQRSRLFHKDSIQGLDELDALVSCFPDGVHPANAGLRQTIERKPILVTT